MTMTDEYKKVKKDNIIEKVKGITISIFVTGLYLLAVQLLWNYVTPKWNLPKLSYVEFCATSLLIYLIYAVCALIKQSWSK